MDAPGPHPCRVEAAAAVEHLEHALVPADLQHNLTGPRRPRVQHHVRAGFGGREQQVRRAVRFDAETAENLPEHMAHDRNADRLAREHETEPPAPSRSRRMERSSQHSLPTYRVAA